MKKQWPKERNQRTIGAHVRRLSRRLGKDIVQEDLSKQKAAKDIVRLQALVAEGRTHEEAIAAFNKERLGLSPDAVSAQDVAIGALRVRFDAHYDLFIPDEAGVPAIIIAPPSDDPLNDVVAFDPDMPSQSASFTGRMFALGDHLIDNPATYFAGRALPVYRNPLIEANKLPGQAVACTTSLPAALALIGGLEPKNEAQAAQAVHLAALHSAIMNVLGRIHNVGERNMITMASAGAKLEKAFQLGAETYYRLRRGVHQVVRIERVEVKEGGQAAIGLLQGP